MENYIEFSPCHIYKRRKNKPSAGMNGTDAFDIARKGVTLEELVPSQEMTDAELDSTEIPEHKEEVGKIFKISNYVIVPAGDIDTIASVMQTTGKAIMLWFFFKRDEWTNHPKVKDYSLSVTSPGVSRHSVAGVDYCLVDGKKSIIIEDSWGTSYGIAGQRVIDEDFFKTRNWFAAYPMNFAFDEETTPPVHYTFTKQMSFGDNNQEVVQLQKVLQHEGFFPSNVNTTGFYGGITSKALLAWQIKHEVASMEELQSLQGRVCGPKTILALNKLYG